MPQSRSLGARSVSILPVVYQGERQAFERFLSLNAPYVNGKATSRLAPQQQADALVRAHHKRPRGFLLRLSLIIQRSPRAPRP